MSDGSEGKHLLIVFHSQGGGTEAMAEAVRRGAAQEEGVEVRMRRALEAGLDDLLWAEAVIFGTPELTSAALLPHMAVVLASIYLSFAFARWLDDPAPSRHALAA